MAKVRKGIRKSVRALVVQPKPHGWDHGMIKTPRKRKVKHT